MNTDEIEDLIQYNLSFNISEKETLTALAKDGINLTYFLLP